MSLIQGQANTTTVPGVIPENTTTIQQAMDKYSSTFVVNEIPTKHVAALRGHYYSYNLGGTAVVTSLTALTEASPACIIENTAPAGGPNILLDYFRIYATAIAAAAVDLQYAWKLDSIRGKWGSAGSAITPQNANMGLGNASLATVHFGALVVATANQSSSNARQVAGGFLRPTATAPAQIIGDTFDFRFGALEAPLPTVMSNVASAGANTFPVGLCVPVGPIVLMPGTTATLFLWGTTAGSAASYAVQGGHYEY
jgi:hypothetical protein